MVQSMILNQLSNQVRVVTLAAERGYPLQAMAGVSVVYELAAAVGFIGESSERAEEWYGHADTNQSYPSTRKRRAAMSCLLEASGVSAKALQRETDVWESRYEGYCMAKHGNPTVLRRYGLVLTDDVLRLFHGPVGGGRYHVLSKLALLRASELLAMAILVFMKPLLGQLPKNGIKGLTRRASRVSEMLVEARSQMPQRSEAN
jgi:hypothetical protein